jgi:molybdopterin synthase catalytic subunit
LDELSKRDGIVEIKVWINEGLLKIGDDIMYALVAGKFRTSVIPVLEELVSRIKKEIVSEKEIFNLSHFFIRLYFDERFHMVHSEIFPDEYSRSALM